MNVDLDVLFPRRLHCSTEVNAVFSELCGNLVFDAMKFGAD
jgi:hypothetical protein